MGNQESRGISNSKGKDFHDRVSYSDGGLVLDEATNSSSIRRMEKRDYFFNSCPLLENDSPARKRIKVLNESYSSSLPNSFSYFTNNCSSAATHRLSPIDEQGNFRFQTNLTLHHQENNNNRHFLDERDKQHFLTKSVTFSDGFSLSPKNLQTKSCPERQERSANFLERIRRDIRQKLNSNKKLMAHDKHNNFVDFCDSASSVKIDDEQENPPIIVKRTSSSGQARFFGKVSPVSSSRSGLKIAVKSISAWLLDETPPTSIPDAWNTLDSGASIKSSYPSSYKSLPDSFRRWSIKDRVEKKPNWRSLFYTPERTIPTCASTDTAMVSSTSSSMMSVHAKTKWPTSRLESIFLPHFPHKSAITENSFTILGTIAKGTFGKVYRVCLQSKQDFIFAMKVQLKSKVIAQNAVDQIKDEVAIHRSLGNFNFIAEVYCTWQNRSKLYMVLQYVQGYGDLYQFWRDEGPFRENVVQIWIAELATALDYIHGCGVIYRDIKMENIMLDQNGHVQLIDFGLSKWLSYGERTNTICGTLQYMAPEVLNGELYNHGADWWCLGVLMHTLLTGSYPFGISDSHTTMHITEYVPADIISQDGQSLLNKLLCQNPKWRLRSLTAFKMESFFDGMNFEHIKNKKVHPFDMIPRMKKCQSCNTINEDVPSLEDCASAMFDEDYSAVRIKRVLFDYTSKFALFQFKDFDYFDYDKTNINN